VKRSAVKENIGSRFKQVDLYLDPMNSRLKIMDFPKMTAEVLEDIKGYAAQMNFGKILCNCRIEALGSFIQSGFTEEGHIDGFFNGDTAYCVSYFINGDREIPVQEEVKDKIIAHCQASERVTGPSIQDRILIRDAEERDIPRMIGLFKEIFETYPSPVFDADYLRNSMQTKTMFKVAIMDGEILSIASADMDLKNNNAEITDCATKPIHRGKGLLTYLIAQLEESLRQKEFKTLYSLSRAIEPGINKALWKMHYEYSGRLVNNCDICGGFEDMNIWVKRL